jgi:pimeloyl-ACP methyl ester carboxylesterase
VRTTNSTGYIALNPVKDLGHRLRVPSVILFLVILGSTRSHLMAQNTSASQACGAIAAGFLGCALAENPTDCAWLEGLAQTCTADTNSLQPPNPPPPSPSTPCSSGGGLEARPGRGSRSSSPRSLGNQSLVPCVEFVDPIPDLVNAAGTDVVADPIRLSAGGRVVTGIAADAASRVVIRIYANSPGDQLTVTLEGDGGGNPNNLPQPYGYLKTLLPADGGVSGATLNVTAVSTRSGPMAFVTYFPSADFSRGGSDDTAASRTVTIRVTSMATGANYALGLPNLRPPVLLVHGIWGSPNDWLSFGFDPGVPNQNASPTIGDFWTKKADYSTAIPGGVSSTVPDFSQLGNLTGVPAQNSLGFSYNAPIVLTQIAGAIQNFRQTQNAAATQADIVAHSMGGDVTLTILASFANAYFSTGPSYTIGPIHKLITIGTPHWGSPVATQILLPQNLCVQNAVALGGKFPLQTASLPGNAQPVHGGIGDLQGCPDSSLKGCGSGVPSAAIQNLHAPGYNGPTVPVAYTGGNTSSANIFQLGQIPTPIPLEPFLAAKLLQGCVASGSPLAADLTPSLWGSVFGGDNDGVVSVSSQLNGGVPGLVRNFVGAGDIHSSGLLSLGFLGSTEQQDPTIANAVRGLLNLPTANFTSLPSGN